MSMPLFSSADLIEKQPNVNPAHAGLAVQHLKKHYGKRTVVKDVSLQVLPGQVVGLLGPNGAGKTTSFYMIVGFVPADEGEILLDGRSIKALSMAQRARLGLAYLPQEPSVFRRLSAAQNIQAVLELKYARQKRKNLQALVSKRTQELLEELQITHLAETQAVALSGGERRRVEIARALANDPRFILLDEPFAGVDPIAILEVQKIIHFLKQRSIGVLITDHNVRETLGICDYAYIISDGRVLASGPPAAIVDHALVRECYLGENFQL